MDIQDLVDNPRETLEIEVKGNLNPTERKHRAALARHVCAISNNGGGYIVFGFDDDLSPIGTATKIHRDDIASIASEYLSPSPHCDLLTVKSSAGNTHAVIRVPPLSETPVCLKKNGPDEGNKGPVVREGDHYCRRLGATGPESARIRSTEEWRPIIERCIQNRREAIIRITGTRESLSQRPQSNVLRERLDGWHLATKREFLNLIKETNPIWNVPLASNHYRLSYAIDLLRPEESKFSGLVEALSKANTDTRELVWSGWSMFYPFSPHQIAPFASSIRTSDNEQTEVLATNLLRERRLSTTLPDCWWVSPTGLATLARAFREDRSDDSNGKFVPGKWFNPHLLIRELSELVRHAHALSVQLGGAEKMAFKCEWLGLKGRKLAESDRDWRPHIARSDECISSGEWPASQLVTDWPSIVSALASPVWHIFDSKFDPTPELVKAESTRFRPLQGLE